MGHWSLDFVAGWAQVPVPMFWAILIILVSVAAGTLLALAPRGRDAWMGPIRSFAFTAALAVVVLHLLPEALSKVGAAAVLVFVLGLFVPELLGKLGVFLWQARATSTAGDRAGNRRDLALEASYAGLLLHRVGDGVGLGAFTGETYALSTSGGVVAALAAHAVPVVAIVVLTFDSVRGRGSALARAGGLALASIVGVFLAHSLPAEFMSAANAWVAAFVGGTLLHVVTHDLSHQLPKTTGDRTWDLLASALGIVVSLIGRGAHGNHGNHDDTHGLGHFEHALTELAVETGPLLVIGLLIAAVITTWGRKIPAAFFRSRGAPWDAARGTLIGAPLPLCSCSVLPISAALKSRGAAPALVVAFLLATPELGVETFALTVRFLGWEFAWIRLVAALLVAFGAAMTLAFVFKEKNAQPALAEDLAQPTLEGSWPQRLLQAFDELFQHVGAWMILGVVAAALLEVALPPEAFTQFGSWPTQFLVVTLVAVPSYVCAPSATPVAAVLLAKGLSPGAVLVGLLLGPATNIATLVFLRRWFGRRAAFVGVLSVVVFSWFFGYLVDTFWTFELSEITHAEEHEHGLFWELMAMASGALLLRAVYRAGVRGFMSMLQGEHGHSHGPELSAPGLGDVPGHAHAHAHGHVHAHGHAHGTSGQADPPRKS